MSTGANLGYTGLIELTVRDAATAFQVANLTVDGIPAVAERADRVHVAGDKLLVVVDAERPEEAIRDAQAAGVEADVWAVAQVTDAAHATAIAAAARSGGRLSVGCVRYGDDNEPTGGLAGWLGNVRP